MTFAAANSRPSKPHPDNFQPSALNPNSTSITCQDKSVRMETVTVRIHMPAQE